MKKRNLNLEILVSVYAPREDSYLLIQAIKVKPKEKVLEVGTGSGIIAIHCTLNKADVTAVDINPQAVKCAKINAKLNNAKIKVLKSNLFSNIKGRFDKIVFNPPYLPSGKNDRYYDIQWSGGKTGVEITNRFLKQAAGHLNEGGRIYFVFSSLADLSEIKAEYKIIKKKRFSNETLFACQTVL